MARTPSASLPVPPRHRAPLRRQNTWHPPIGLVRFERREVRLGWLGTARRICSRPIAAESGGAGRSCGQGVCRKGRGEGFTRATYQLYGLVAGHSIAMERPVSPYGPPSTVAYSLSEECVGGPSLNRFRDGLATAATADSALRCNAKPPNGKLLSKPEVGPSRFAHSVSPRITKRILCQYYTPCSACVKLMRNFPHRLSTEAGSRGNDSMQCSQIATESFPTIISVVS